MDHNSFLNGLDADENFFNDTLTDISYTLNCKHFSVEKLNEFNKKNKNNPMILNINVQSSNCNFDKFRLLFRNQQDYPSVLILTETWIPSDNVCGLQGYQALHVYRTNWLSGGVSVYINNNLICAILDDLPYCDTTIENVGFRVSINMFDFCILAIYRPRIE